MAAAEAAPSADMETSGLARKDLRIAEYHAADC
jgi:hypothetical protein